MKSQVKMKMAVVGSSMLFLAGCGMFGGEEETTTPVAQEEDRSAQVATYDGDSNRNVNVIKEPKKEAVIPEQTVIYFDFDKATVKPESHAVLRAHARYMSENGVKEVTLAGHADERGTREYNMALGEERSKAVRDLLLAFGADQEKLETVSYGEELPVVKAKTETSHALNRRVELKYKQ